MRIMTLLILMAAMLMVFVCADAAVNDDRPGEIDKQILPITESAVFEQTAAARLEDRTATVFKLPASLQIIEDEAFEGTALVSVELPESVERIGERAFADIPTLLHVKIPEKTKFIAGTAFAGSAKLTLTGAPGSYARAWARENGVPFAPLMVISASAQTVQFVTVSVRRSETLQAGEVLGDSEKDRQNPTGQTVGEIRDHRCHEGVAYHIQGRSPPTHA